MRGDLGRPARLATASLGLLALLALSALTANGYMADRWLTGVTLAHRVAEVCRSVADDCGASLSPIVTHLPGVRGLFVVIGFAALAVVMLKSVCVLLLARRLGAKEEAVTEIPQRLKRALAAIGASNVPVRLTPSVNPVAFTAGLIKPTIHLSTGLVESLDDSQLRAVVAHEYAHATRADNLRIFIALMMRDLAFIFPLSHLLLRAFMRYTEHAADDYAARVTGDPVGLAGAIIEVSRLKNERLSSRPAYASFFSEKTSTRERVTRLLGDGSPTGKRALRVVAAAAVTLAMVAAIGGVALARPETGSLSAQCRNNDSCVKMSGACCLDK